MRRSSWFGRLVRMAGVVALLLLAVAQPVLAVAGEITSSGPLTRIIVSPELFCQVAHEADELFEFYGGERGSCGTFLATGGTLYGPSGGPVAATGWTPVSQTEPIGTGSGGDPLRTSTVVEVAAIGLRIEEVDSYQVGGESYRTDVTITNAGPAGAAGHPLSGRRLLSPGLGPGIRPRRWRVAGVRHLTGPRCPHRAMGAADAGQLLLRVELLGRLAADLIAATVPQHLHVRRVRRQRRWPELERRRATRRQHHDLPPHLLRAAGHPDRDIAA